MMQFAQQDFKIVRHVDAPSTNLLAIEFGEQGAAHGTVITALQQTGGRGRLGRKFSSPPGGLYFSLILRPEFFPQDQSFITLLAGMVCCKTIERVAEIPVMLKWPNDLYVENRKLGGILTEAAPYSYQTGQIPFLVIGIGLNINSRISIFPQELQESIISLCSLQKREYNLDDIMLDIVNQILEFIHSPQDVTREIFQNWEKRDFLYGKHLCWHSGRKEQLCGIGAGLNKDGRYLLQTAEGKQFPIIGGELKIVHPTGSDNLR